VVNERDGLGDDLPPDCAPQVREGGFYGWPWYYIGGHSEPRMNGARPELAGQVSLPDVLIQAHSAPLGIAFYDGTQFPPEYRGDAFVALHGSWNRSQRTGYKIVRLRFQNGPPTGMYEDFLTGFVASDRAVWARPVGVTVMHDGSLLVSEDGNGTLWRVAYRTTS
jgi:glucose/arabinose dehydrogenase